MQCGYGVGHWFARPPAGLLEEWVRRPVRRGEEDDAWCVPDDPLYGRSNRRTRGDPHQEHRVDTVQGPIESVGDSEVAGDDFNWGG